MQLYHHVTAPSLPGTASHSYTAVLGGPWVRVGSLPWSWPARAHGAPGNSHEKCIVSIQLPCTCSRLAA